MTYFHNRLEEIKKHGNIDFLKIKFGLDKIILKLVDTSDETVSLLYNLRKKYRKMFATDFEMTEDKTRNWIKNLILGNPERILFIIYFDNKKIGCIGNGGYDKKNNSSRLDNMMKDPLCNLPGAMTIVEKVYLKWMFDDLKLSKITGFLFSDNNRMINIHEKCGWITTDVVPIKKISTGDLVRSHIKENTELGKIANEYYIKGDLVPDKIPTNMVKEWILNQIDSKWLIDGFPRNINQAESLNNILSSVNSNINTVLFINVDTKLLIERLLNRQSIENRSDDNLETIKNRISIYEKETSPLIGFYNDKKLLYKINGNKPIKSVYQEIENYLIKKKCRIY